MRHKTGTTGACAVSCWASAMLLLLVACERAPEPEPMRSFTGPTMGTTYHVTVAGLSPDDARARGVQHCVEAVLRNVDEHLSTYSATSEITALNRSASTDWMPVSEPLFAVLAAANRVSVETGGAFDVTVAPFVRLWGFGPGGEKDAAPELPPSPEFIHDAAAITGYTWLELRASPDRAVRKNRTPLELDVNGIAPGYAVDRISGCLTRAQFPDHLVEIGGEVRAAGMTIPEFSDQLRVALLEYVRQPNISVEVVNSRPLFILGEVQRPGTYPYSDSITVLNSVETAGGFTYRANRGRVFIRHANEQEEHAYPLTIATPVLPGDTVRIGERLF